MKALNNLMRQARGVALALFLGMFGSLSHGADTDLFFTGASGLSSRPNVLIMLDNTANWSPMFVAEKEALVGVLKSLPKGVFNIGLMMFVETGGGNDNNDGTYVRFAVRPFDNFDPDTGGLENAAETLTQLVADLHELNDKSNNAVYGLAMNEAYKYFNQGNSYSRVQLKRDYYGNPVGRPTGIPGGVLNGSGLNKNAFSGIGSFVYQSPVVDACQQNHIIIISNGKGNDNNSATVTARTALTDEGGDVTDIPVSPNGYQSNVADEWARFMSRDRLETETKKTVVYTHTILVEAAGAPGGQYPYDWEVFLKSMAVAGQGSFQKTDGSATQIANALNRAFKEIQDVSSVFASSTLPINVNVRGTFLNQVYMGVFRPEAQGTPRWTGNLKMYKLAYDGALDRTFLADRNGLETEDPKSGFILASSTSFWTTTSTFWDQDFASAFYFYADVETVSDAPDGDFVEKGGAAQRLRSQYPSSLTPRPIYTSAGVLPPGTTPGGEVLKNFDTGNTDITATGLALTDVVTVFSLIRSGSTATVTTASPHGFATNDSISIDGAVPSEYNGAKIITVTGPTTFTFAVTETPPTSASGTLIGRLAGAGSVTVTSIARVPGTNTFRVQAPGHGFSNGQTVTISGALPTDYNIAAVISGVTTNTFDYVVPETPSTTIGITGARVCANATATTTCTAAIKAITSASRVAGSPLTTISTFNVNHGFTEGNWILIEGLLPVEYNGRYQVTSVVSNKIFTYTPALTLGPADTSNPALGITASVANTPVSITALTRSGTTVTGTTAVAHTWSAGQSIVISGANEAAYNGTFPLASASGSTFTFTVIPGPVTPASGTMTAQRGGGISRDDLILWVRGANRLYEDNPSGNANHVRGYIHGDVLHSRPAVVNYGRASQPENRDILVFYGGNDGMLHAVKGGREDADGLERWAYIAEDHFPNLKTLYTATPPILSSPRKYFFDGSISVYQKDADGDGELGGTNDKVWLYAAMRRGGRGVHALNVSNPDVAPILLWKKTNADPGYTELGETWSEVQPIVIASQSAPALVFGLGYDSAAEDPAGLPTSTTQPIVSSRQSTATMGRGLMVADAGTGAPIWVATGQAAYSVPSPGVAKYVPGMDCPIVSDISAVDLDTNGTVDRFYAADTCGNVWRFNVQSSDVTAWTVQKLAALGGSGTSLRKFLFRPDVVRLTTEPTKLAILIGSGDREAPFDTSVSNAFFMIKDDIDSATCTNCGIVGAGLCERNSLANPTAVAACTTQCQGASTLPDPTTGLTCFQACLASTTACTIDHDNNTSTPVIDVSARGWKYTYPQTSGQFGEKTVNAPLTVGGTVFFGTNVPQSLVAADVCGGLGQARLYQIEYSTGAPAYDPSGSGVSTYFVERKGGGFPPSPVGTVVTTDEGKTVEVVLSGSQVQKPPSIPLEKRFRIYWYKLLDRQ